MAFEKECCSLWRWDNPSSSNTSFLLLRVINKSVHNGLKGFQSFHRIHPVCYSKHRLVFASSFLFVYLLLFSISLYVFMLMGSVGLWVRLVCVDLSAKSATHWPSLIKFPGNFLCTLSLWSSSGKYRDLQGKTVGGGYRHRQLKQMISFQGVGPKGVTHQQAYNTCIVSHPPFNTWVCLCFIILL